MNPMIKKTWILVVAVLALVAFADAAPTVTDVTAKQRYPWNGLVDITCKVSGISGTTNGLTFAVAAIMPDSDDVRNVATFWVVQGGTNSTDREVHANGDYWLVWDAHADLGSVRYSNMVVRVATSGVHNFGAHNAVQLWEVGPYWAETNIGAEEPWEYGFYFWWGDTVGYMRTNDAWLACDGSSSGFSFGEESTPTFDKDLSVLENEGWVTADNVLVPEHDAAQVRWGGEWRMPTLQELDGLTRKCDWTWTTTNGINGYIVRGRGKFDSAGIFLPAAGSGRGTSLFPAGMEGSYWSSVSYSNCSHRLFFSAYIRRTPCSIDRHLGHPVRPVQSAMTGQAGDSEQFPLDTLDGPRVAREIEPITYSPRWNGSASCSVTVATSATFPEGGNGGEVLVASATEEGTTTWSHPETYGLYTLTHTAGGEALTAQFVVPDPIPEIDGDADVAGALAGTADNRLAYHIKTATQYNAYRAWVNAYGFDHGTVTNSPRAWFSYALDASNLVERVFQNGDVAIVSLETASDGTFMFEVDVKDVLLGSSATATNLATVFEVQGSPSLSEKSFSAENVVATFGVSASGRLLVCATPTAAYGTFFVRVRMYADGGPHLKVQLWEGGPCWAETNIGADAPWVYGYHFWWGDAVGYKYENNAWVAVDGSSSDFQFHDDPISQQTSGNIDMLQIAGWITADNVLAPEHDAAQMQWGGGWRMPTDRELGDLINNCDWTWTAMNGVSGYVVRGRDDFASASIFLPAAGLGYMTTLYSAGFDGGYWSSVPGADFSDGSWSIHFISNYYGTSLFGRFSGLSVRPVQGFTK